MRVFVYACVCVTIILATRLYYMRASNAASIQQAEAEK